MDIWEYRQIEGRNLQDELNRLGAEGWRVISISVLPAAMPPSPSPDSDFLVVAILERRAKAESAWIVPGSA